MPKRVLDVGQCGPDHATISAYLAEHFPGTVVVQAHGAEDALVALRESPFDLVLVNRKLDRDYSDGIEIVQAIKGDAEMAGVAVMLVTNFAEHQQAAVDAGAEPGFGKLQYDKPETRARLARFLG